MIFENILNFKTITEHFKYILKLMVSGTARGGSCNLLLCPFMLVPSTLHEMKRNENRPKL